MGLLVGCRRRLLVPAIILSLSILTSAAAIAALWRIEPEVSRTALGPGRDDPSAQNHSQRLDRFGQISDGNRVVQSIRVQWKRLDVVRPCNAVERIGRDGAVT